MFALMLFQTSLKIGHIGSKSGSHQLSFSGLSWPSCKCFSLENYCITQIGAEVDKHCFPHLTLYVTIKVFQDPRKVLKNIVGKGNNADNPQ